MRLLYVGDTGSPHFRAWPAHFAKAGHEVHALHLSPSPSGAPIPGAVMHPPPRAGSSRVRGAWLAGALAARRLWRQLRPDVVHSHQVIPAGFLCELGGLSPHVATAWGSEVLMAGRVDRPMVRRVASGAALITADSHHLLGALQREGAPADRLRWVPWGVSADWRRRALAASPTEAAGLARLPADRRLVLSHRGTRPVYRQPDFVRAMAELRRRGSGALGVIVSLEPGPGREGTEEVESLIAELGVGESVLMVPPYPHDRIGFAYRAAGVCVSVPESDSAPTSVFEALAVGTPAVVSDLPWVHEAVHSEARVGVVPVGDHAAMAHAIEAALERPSEADARANMELVERRFDRDRVFGEIGAEYERLAGGAAP